MTSRERVLTACRHRQPDQVPIDFSGHPSSGIAAIAYARLRDYLGLPKKTIRVYDPIQQLAIVDEDVLDRFGVDVLDLGRGFGLDEASWADWILPAYDCSAPVNAPRAYPNSSASISVSGMAAQLTTAKGRPLRGLRSCSARATSSLPLPVGPVSRTVVSRGASSCALR